MKPIRVALVQMGAGSRVAENLDELARLTSRLTGYDLIALPEVFVVRGTDADYRGAAESLDGPVIRAIAGLARGSKAWVLAGSVLEKAGRDVYNTSVLLDRSGTIEATYRKIHLFEAQLDDGTRIRESTAYKAGRKPTIAGLEGWRVGMAVCYDLRFPELFRHYSALGANLFFVPSNFTQRTGKDHWEVLVRARAIENQCFVLAPNQCGLNPATGVRSHGHSMAVGPWGEVLCEAGAGATVVAARLDPEELWRTRKRIPALKHRVMG